VDDHGGHVVAGNALPEILNPESTQAIVPINAPMLT
jgi:hypothetical protein